MRQSTKDPREWVFEKKVISERISQSIGCVLPVYNNVRVPPVANKRPLVVSGGSQQAFPTHFQGARGHIIGFAECTSLLRGLWDMHQDVSPATLAAPLPFNVRSRPHVFAIHELV